MSNTIKPKKTAKKATGRKAAAAGPAVDDVTPEDVHDLLADPTAGPATRAVQLCLRADLQAEWEELVALLDAMQVEQIATMVERAERRKLAEQVIALEQRMRAATVAFKVRASRSEWRRLTAAHPPRKGEDGKVIPEDAMGVNSETFFEPLIRAMVVEPQLSDDEWIILLGGTLPTGEEVDGRLTDGQLDQLWQAAWNVNRGKADVPFSRAASRMMTDSEPESRQHARSGSASSGSRAGSRSR